MVGIEINEYARRNAEKLGVKCVASASELPRNYADLIISSHVLEHVENPLGELRKLFDVLKENGKIVFYVPNESGETEYERSSIDNHLYTWNCLTIGNLFKAAGFFVQKVEMVQEMWPSNYSQLYRELGWEHFEELCYLKGKLFNNNSCLIVATK